MNITLNTKYSKGPGVVYFGGRYGDGAIALRVTSPEGEPLFTATVCIVDYGFTPNEGEVVIKNYSENEGVLNCLIDQGVVRDPEHTISGPHGIEFPVCKLSTAMFAEIAKAEGRS